MEGMGWESMNFLPEPHVVIKPMNQSNMDELDRTHRSWGVLNIIES